MCAHTLLNIGILLFIPISIVSLPARDPDDLVAMGTNWNPNNGSGHRSNGRPNSHNNGNLVYQMSQSNAVSTQTSTINSRRVAPKAASIGTQGRTRERK